MADPDLEIAATASARELRVRHRSDTRVTSIGSAKLRSESERRNLPPDAETDRLYRDVTVESRRTGRLESR